MDGLRRTFFEDPLYVYVALGVVAFVLLAVWYERRQAKWLVRLLLVAALAGGVWWLERAVVTDREQITGALHEIARAAERRDIAAAGTYLDDNYGGWKGSKPLALAAAKIAVEAYALREVKFLGQPEVSVRPGGAAADCTVRTVVYYGTGETRGRALLGWDVEWIKRPAGWRIRRAVPTSEPLP